MIEADSRISVEPAFFHIIVRFPERQKRQEFTKTLLIIVSVRVTIETE